MARRTASQVEHPEKFQPHLFTLYERLPWRFIDNLPVEWSHLICKCDRFYYVTNFDNVFQQPPKCGYCFKAPITHFCKCGKCGEFFIRNFSHPRHCNYCDMMCWECCKAAENTETFCCDAQAWKVHKLPTIREPRGIFQPSRLYSTEELYAPIESFTL